MDGNQIKEKVSSRFVPIFVFMDDIAYFIYYSVSVWMIYESFVYTIHYKVYTPPHHLKSSS